MQNDDRYNKINSFLRRRYTKNGWLVTHSRGQETRYTKLDILAWKKYVLSTIQK